MGDRAEGRPDGSSGGGWVAEREDGRTGTQEDKRATEREDGRSIAQPRVSFLSEGLPCMHTLIHCSIFLLAVVAFFAVPCRILLRLCLSSGGDAQPPVCAPSLHSCLCIVVSHMSIARPN